MNKNVGMIPLTVDIDRIIEVLATQIYQSPLALLRENAQNAFDAILLRKAANPNFAPRIDITIKPTQITVADNGIGMTPNEVENHFWKAGSSSKNNEYAKSAGVVGTFGIGAMANFGVARKLVVETESYSDGCRSTSSAERESLSVSENCIEINKEMQSLGSPGTKITVELYKERPLNVTDALNYIAECVAFTQIPIYANGDLISQKDIDHVVPLQKISWEINEQKVSVSQRIILDICLTGNDNGEVRIELTSIEYNSQQLKGRMILGQNVGILKTYRSGFSLANTSLGSVYHLGGVADFLFLQPTAGREALEVESLQVLQDIFTDIENYISCQLSRQPQADKSTAFMNWVINHNRYELCEQITIRTEPDSTDLKLVDVKKTNEQSALNYYDGQDRLLIDQYASEDTALLVAAVNNPRRKCQQNFITLYCQNIEHIDDSPRVLSQKEKFDYSLSESALVFRLSSILEADYFVEANVQLAPLSHQLPVYVETTPNLPNIYVNPDSQSASILLSLYEREYEVFSSMAKDFVRSMIFPKISNLVPSATREGAEAFLKKMRSKREIFEYEEEDLGSLSDIWDMVVAGKITVDEGAKRSQIVAKHNIQIVDSGAVKAAHEVVPGLTGPDNQLLQTGAKPGQPMPAVSRTDIEIDAKLLVIDDDEQALNGFQCFLAITDRIREQHGEFFLQPHTTSVIWGGQRILLIFQHHSGQFGLYYDIQLPDVITESSGGEFYPTTTIVLENRTFIPIPKAIQSHLIPLDNTKKRLAVRCEFIHIDSKATAIDKVVD